MLNNSNYLPKIRPENLENSLYSIKGTTETTCNIMFVDFQYSTSTQPITSTLTRNTSTTSYPNTIGPSVYSKTIKLKQIILDKRYLSPEYIRNEINKDFYQLAIFQGKQNRETAPIKNFDINIREIKKKKVDYELNDIARSIIGRFNHVSNYIAVTGRIGPVQYFISNMNTYQYILEYLNDIPSLFNDKGQMMIGNMNYIIDNLIDDDIIVAGRKNSIDQPGLHAFILTDNDGFIQTVEYADMSFKNNYDVGIYYDVQAVGLSPQYNYFVINTRDIAYYRKLKLQRIKKIYG